MKKMKGLFSLGVVKFAKRFVQSTLGNILIYAMGISLGVILLLDLTWNSQREEKFFFIDSVNHNLISGSFQDGSTETLISNQSFQINREYPLEIRGFKNPLLYRKASLIEY
jgi:hypothetical protein